MSQLTLADREPIDVVLVRWGQRLLDAVDVVHAIRRDGDHTPIAVYDPAGRSELEVASILNAGADDFMSTPELRPNELIARLRVLQRRRPFSGHRRFTVGRITFDVERREVLVDDKNINASTGEYRLLSYMARRVGAVITRRELYLAVFETHDVDKRSNALAAAISRLRRKLGAAGDQLVAVAGVGYRLDDARTSGMRLAAASLASSSSLEIHSKDRG